MSDGGDIRGAAAPAHGGARAPARFAWRRGWLLAAALGGGAMAMLSGWMAWMVGVQGFGDLSAFGHGVIAFMFAAFALVLGAASITYGVALGEREAVVTLDARGVHDRRLTREPIAWADLRGVLPMVYNGQTMLILDVEQPDQLAPAANRLWALNRMCGRLLGRPQLAIRMNGLDGDLQALIKALQSAAPEPASQ